MKIHKTAQQGFAHWHLLLVIAVVAVIGFVGGNVYQAQVKKQQAAREAAKSADIAKQAKLKAEEAAKEEKVDIPKQEAEQKPVEKPAETKPAPAPAPKKTTPAPAPKKDYTWVGISSVTHSVDGDTITLTATIPGSYSGVCGFKVKLTSDYSKYYYQEASLNGTTCSTTLSKATLQAQGAQWISFTNFRTHDYKVKGDHSGYTFNL